MLELLAYLRANGFKTFIVSGGGIEFMRPWTEKVYGIPPEQVVGSSRSRRSFRCAMADPELFRLPEVNFVDDGAANRSASTTASVAPIAAFGNSDGDLEMLQWTTMAGGVRFGLIVHTTPAMPSEYASDDKDSVIRSASTRLWTLRR